MPEGGIFISYRRADSASMAGRIRERLLEALLNRPVFLDVESIDLGANFDYIIQTALSKSEVMLVLIGNNWVLKNDGKKQSRIHDPDDYVRREIDWALQSEVRLIPVVIDNARMPSPDQLPTDIREFATKNAAELRNSRFDDDFEHLLDAIDAQRVRFVHRRGSRVRAVLTTIAGALTGLLALIGALIVHQGLTQEPISIWLGLWGAVMLVPISLLVGGVVGWYLNRRRSANLSRTSAGRRGFRTGGP
jgi:hypothetical protein